MTFRRDRRPNRARIQHAIERGHPIRYFMRTWGGLGDNVYLRPAVRGLAGLGEVWVETPWPEVYEDLPVRFVRPDVHDRTYPTLDLRHARRNLAAQLRSWDDIPSDALEVRPYVLASSSNVVDGLLRGLRFRHPVPAGIPHPTAGPGVFDLPDLGPPPVEPPYAIVRPAVLRREWMAPARNPRPEYLANAALQLQLRGLPVVSIADVMEGEECIVPPEPPADVRFHRAELSIRELLSLLAHAAIIVGGVGFILPVAIAAGVPLLVVAGGHGRTECEEWLTAPWMDTSRTRWLYPDHFCRCSRMDHDCPKEISDFHTKAAAALEELLP